MAEDFGDKTEAPTPHRREEARKQGKIARSPDLAGAVLLLGAMFLLRWSGPNIVKALRGLLEETLSAKALSNTSGRDAMVGTATAVVSVGKSLLPLFAGIMLLAIAVNLAQVGFAFDFSRLQPNLAALNPFKGIGTLFSRRGGPIKALIVAAKLAVIAMVAWSAISGRLAQLVSAQELEFLQIFSLASEVIYSVSMRIGVVLLILAILDFGYQKWRIEQELKMTKQEIKEEMRRMEGDPKIKLRRRQIAQQIATQKLRKDVPTADVIVTNPTHFAVALKYDSKNMHAPKVVAKGQDFLALRIREIAVAAGVPILERKPLARALYRMVEVGQEIPEQFYSAVAEILAYVYELSGKAKSGSPR